MSFVREDSTPPEPVCHLTARAGCRSVTQSRAPAFRVKTFVAAHCIVGGVALALVAGGSPRAFAQTPTLEDLQRMIEQQQRMIEELQRQVEELQTPTPAKEGAAAPAGAAPAPPPTEAAAEPVISDAQPRVTLSISGHINRAVNIADDGDTTKAYFVDNETSVSRVRVVGTGEVNDDVTLGTQIELGIAPNSAADVSQVNEESGDKFDERVVEAWIESERYGQLTLGKGSTSADGASQIDLSGTDVLAHSAIHEIAGGLLFRDDDGDLTDIAIADAFTDFDGTRRSRIRYDTPEFGGFSLSGSAFSDQRYDAALLWAGKGDVISAAAAAALQFPNLDDVDARYNGSFSILHVPSGLNLTASAGSDLRDIGADPVNLYLKAGWITRPFEIGDTNLSIDFTQSWDIPIDESGVDRTDGNSVGAAAVQNIADYGTELYIGLRWYGLVPSGAVDLDDIWVGTTGARVKF